MLSPFTKPHVVQAIDFKGENFCLRIGHFVETRINTALAACQEALVHTVIHISCGYRRKPNKIKHLSAVVCASSSL
jgi:hypothetical protein